jgi:uncharacterized protein (TIGR02611 family)
MKFAYQLTYRYARRIVIALIGSTVLLAGVIMLVTPGPAFVVIPVGLGILGLEFAWARRWLAKVREKISEQTARARAKRNAARRPDGADSQ